MRPGNNSARVRWIFIRMAVLFIALGICLLPVIAQAQQTAAPKSILILYWYNREYAGNITFEQNFRTGLQSVPPGTVEYYSEYLESNRFPGENQELLMRNYLREKYAGRSIDVIVAVTDKPLEFLLKYRRELFTNIPIVFVGVKVPTSTDLATGPGMTGIVYGGNQRSTLELALRLHPDTEQVFIVSGTLDRDKRFELACRKDLEGYESKVSIIYLTDLPLGELIANVRSLPERSIVLYLWQQSYDEKGSVLESPDVLALISLSTRVPIYGLTTPMLGSGIVGGNLRFPERIATSAAEIAMQIVTGTRAQDIPVQTPPTVPMFDWSKLRHWGISEDQLPPGSIVRFREPSFWDEYKWYAIALFSVILLQSALIAGIFINRARRKRAEESLQQTQAELAHVARVMITGELAATIAHEVNQPLTAMVANANATRRMLGNGNENLDEVREAIDDIVKDAHRASEVLGRIRSLLRKDPHRTEPLGINDVIEEVLAIARNDLVGKRVTLRMELGEGLPKVEADRVEIQQVILNLIMNAVEAMRIKEEGGRNLLMKTRRDGAQGVVVEVEDSGVGIAPEKLERIFETFYTTRPEGMGMGLPICRTIIEAHGGKLWAESNQEKGATFRFTLITASAAETKKGV